MFELVRKAKKRDSVVRGTSFPEPYVAQAEFDYTESDAERLIAVILTLFQPLLERMKIQAQGVNTIHLRLTRDDGGVSREKLQTAKPTLTMTTLTDLLRLRLHAIKLNEGVTKLAIHLIPGALPDPQLNLLPALAKTGQIIFKANRAIARIEAEFGTGAVFRAKCRKSHLPEDSFRWECFDELRHSTPTQPASTAMMRRFLDHPRRISMPHQTSQQRIFGPYSISGFLVARKQCSAQRLFCRNLVGKCTMDFLRQIEPSVVCTGIRSIAMSSSVYTPLWCKSNYSFLEGASFPEQYISKAAKLGLPSIALADRDGVYGIVKAHLAALEHNVHLIVGSQVTISEIGLLPFSIVLLVQDKTGYSNLCKLITLGRRRCEKGESAVTLEECCLHAPGLYAMWPPENAVIFEERSRMMFSAN